jgi:hypothetical protein
MGDAGKVRTRPASFMAELSAELMESTLRGLRGDSRNRKHPRAPMRVKLKLFPVERRGLGKPRDVWTRDLSAGGIGLLSPDPMTVGSKFIMRLPRQGGGFLCLLCCVQNCEEKEKDLYAVGASFVEVTHSASNPAEEPAQPVAQPAAS